MNCLFCITLPSINLHISVYISLRLIPFCGFTIASKLHQLRWSICNNQPSNQASNQTINQPTINRPNLPPLNIIGKKKCKFNKLMTINFICYCWKKKKRNWHFVVVYSTNQLKAHYIRTYVYTYIITTNILKWY